jgi:hypothetical protein
MDNLFHQLYEIESTASSILERANAKKKQLAAGQEERILAFTEETNRQTEEKIRQQKELCQAQIEERLQQERLCTQQQLAQLEQEYASNHTVLAGQLLANLIKE